MIENTPEDEEEKKKMTKNPPEKVEMMSLMEKRGEDDRDKESKNR